MTKPGVYTVTVGTASTFQVDGPDGEWVDCGFVSDRWADKSSDQILDDVRELIDFTVSDGQGLMSRGETLTVTASKKRPPTAAPSWEKFRNRRPGRHRRK